MPFIHPVSYMSAGASAGNDSFTKILLHFDGADASTTATDSNAGGSAHTWTANGDAQLDTGITPKFGTAAALFDGTGDYFSTPDHADFTLGSGDFTIDFWFNVNTAGNGTFRYISGQSNAAGSNTSVTAHAYLSAGNLIGIYLGSGGVLNNYEGTTAITTTGWHHYACVRTGNTVKLFLDGVQENSQSYSSTLQDSAETYSVGRSGAYASNAFYGSIDEFRLSVGIARWTAGFTPPTVAYS